MADRSTTKASPLKLPVAPEKYDKRDQDHTRRLIELALIQFGLQMQQSSGGDPEVGGGQDQLTDPNAITEFATVSPVHGSVMTTGSATPSAPFIQLKNPSNSGRIVLLYEVQVSNDSVGGRVYWRYTRTPTDLSGGGAAITTGFAEHRDENDVTAIFAELKGTTNALAYFAESTDSQFTSEMTQMGGNPEARETIMIASNTYETDWFVPNLHPIILLPGMAWEMTATTTGAAIALRAFPLWDEIVL